MPIEMYLHLPLSGASAEKVTIDEHAAALAAIYAAPKPEKTEEEPEDDGYNWRRRGRGGDNLPEGLSKFHESKGFMEILAWSHGASSSATVFNSGRGNMQDISMTKYNDKFSPLAYVAVMRGEIMPNATLRCVSVAKDGKFEVIEYNMELVQLSSLSTGGSGGEDRLTENITLTFGKMSVRKTTVEIASGDIVADAQGTWDLNANEGARDGTSTVAPLSIFCKRYFNENRSLFDRKDLIRLIKLDLLEASEAGIDKASLHLPVRGRRLVFAVESKKDRFREGFIHKLSVDAVKAAAAEAFGMKSDAIDAAFLIDGRSRLVELIKDEQVEDLTEDDSIIFSVKA